MSKKDHLLYKINFVNHGKVYELYAKEVNQSNIYGFIEVNELIFNKESRLVVDPSEEKLKTEFRNVKYFMVPVHAVIRIDRVEKQGTAKILPLSEKNTESNVANFPTLTPSLKD